MSGFAEGRRATSEAEPSGGGSGGGSHDPERSKTLRGPFGPDRPPTQNLNFRLRQLSEASSRCCMAALTARMVFKVMAQAWLALAYSAGWFLLL